jgi:hypothetical protein
MNDMKFTTAGDYMEQAYDVVLDTLQQKRDKLWEMTKRNMNSDYIGMNIMDDIRLRQIEQLDEAINLWKTKDHDHTREL